MGPDLQQVYAKHLREAATLVEAALKLLNTSKKTCSGCGLERALDWGEAKTAEELSGVVRKLKRAANPRKKP